MDLTVLPTIFALSVFVFCFRPLVRRAGAHTNIWFMGWASLLIHYLALVPSFTDRWPDHILTLTSIWGTELCGLCFILAACSVRESRSGRVLAMQIGLPVLLQSLLYSIEWNQAAPRLAVSLLLLVPAANLFLSRRGRERPLPHVAWALAVVACGLVPLAWSDPYIALNLVQCVLFLSAAYLTFAYATRLTRGTALMAGGMVVWALSYLLQAAGWLDKDLHLHRSILDLPRYVVAGGMILWLLDEFLDRAESLALHDPLTGLPNRRHFDNRMNEAIEESARTGIPIACLVIDVDKFKYINDTFGHQVGDGLLIALAKRLSWNLGPRDMLARTGGDEFTAILVEAGDESHVRFIAGAMMAAGCVPVSIDQHLIDVCLSIGIAFAPQDGITSAELHRAADHAMYRAKRSGGSGMALAYEEVEEAQPA